MTPEGKVKQQVKEMLKEAGFWYFMPVAGRGTMGIPDIVGCTSRGQFFAIECKAAKGALTPLQSMVLRAIADNHGFVFVAWPHNLDVLRKALASLQPVNPQETP